MDPTYLYIGGAIIGSLVLLSLFTGGDDDDNDDGGDDRETRRLSEGDDNFDQRLDAEDASSLRVEAGSGDDIVLTGDGDDRLELGANKDPLLDGSEIGADIALSGFGDDVIYGGDGRDVIIGEQGDDTLYGGDGDDIFDDRNASRDDLGQFGDLDGLRDALIAEGFSENLEQFPELNVTDLRPDDDLFYGGAGNDLITSGSGGDTLFGETGDDRLFSQDQSGTENDTLFGGLGDDRLTGDHGDVMYGGTGADVFTFDVFDNQLAPSAQDALEIVDYQAGVDNFEYPTTRAGTLSASGNDEGVSIQFVPDDGEPFTVARFVGLTTAQAEAEITAGRIYIAGLDSPAI